MSCTEISTAARERLPVKFFVLDDQAYHYMQELQNPAYLRTPATILARLDYRSLAMGYGVAYQEIRTNDELEPAFSYWSTTARCSRVAPITAGRA